MEESCELRHGVMSASEVMSSLDYQRSDREILSSTTYCIIISPIELSLTMQALLSLLWSVETLLWFPLGTDLLLLVFTYGYCRVSGVEWFLAQVEKESEDAHHKKTDGDRPQGTAIKVEPKSKKQLEQVWELAMIAYSGYGVLLPWAAYVCYHDPSLRPSFSWAMTALMCTKFFPSHPMVASKGNASLFCSCIFLPTGVTQSTRRSLIVEQNIIPSCLHYEHNMLAVTPSIGHPGHPALRLHGSFGYCG